MHTHYTLTQLKALLTVTMNVCLFAFAAKMACVLVCKSKQSKSNNATEVMYKKKKAAQKSRAKNE